MSYLKELFILICVVIILSGCCTGNSKNFTKPVVYDSGFVITNWKYIWGFDIREVMETGAIEKFERPLTPRNKLRRDSIVFDATSNRLYFHWRPFSHPTEHDDTDSFYKIPLAPKDSANLPKNVLGYELVGVFANNQYPIMYSTVFYVQPTTKNVLRVNHVGSIGNTEDVFFYMRDSIYPLQGHMEEAKRLLNLDVSKRKRADVDSVFVKLKF